MTTTSKALRPSESIVPQCIRVALLGALLLPALARPTVAWQSPADALFVPTNSRVPLSDFVSKDTTSWSTVTMHVDPRILSWLSSHSELIQVYTRKANGATVSTPQSSLTIDPNTGAVGLLTNVKGKNVVVASRLRQDLSIVTHWDHTLNVVNGQPRGGQRPGATDGLMSIDVNLSTNNLVSVGDVLLNTDPNYKDNVLGPYYYSTNTYALFDDGTGQHVNDAVPSFETYIAENYALYKPTDLAAIWLSDQVRATTGFPIAHRNHPNEDDPNAPLGKKLEDDLPLFQVLHARIVHPSQAYDTDPTHSNLAESLGTFVLPPHWTSQVSDGAYPILFNAQYDIHFDGTFAWWKVPPEPGIQSIDDWSKVLFSTIGELYNSDEDRKVVGLFWNGGAAKAGSALNRSAYDNAAQLIADAATICKADKDRVVFSGGSRGGTTALSMGSNPYGLDYTAKYVNSYVPGVRIGSSVRYATPSYWQSETFAPQFSGWKDAWQQAWRDASNRTGTELALLNVFGEEDFSQVDDDLSPISDEFRQGLEDQGTRVVVRYGTNDPFHSYEQVASYYDLLVAEGVPVQLDVYYRFGHQIPTIPPTAEHSNVTLLNSVFDDPNFNSPWLSKVTHYGRSSTAFDVAWPFESDPSSAPLVCETALTVGDAQNHTWSFVGNPGGHVSVQCWNRHQMPSSPNSVPWWGRGTPTTFEGTLAGAPGAYFGSLAFVRAFPYDGDATHAISWERFEVGYDPTGGTNYQIVYTGVAPPSSTLPILFVDPSSEIKGNDDAARTNGLAQDDQFTLDDD